MVLLEVVGARVVLLDDVGPAVVLEVVGAGVVVVLLDVVGAAVVLLDVVGSTPPSPDGTAIGERMIPVWHVSSHCDWIRFARIHMLAMAPHPGLRIMKLNE